MTSRRDFLRRCALLAAGTIAADQLEILDRLSHARVFTTGGYVNHLNGFRDQHGRIWMPASIPDGGHEAIWTPSEQMRFAYAKGRIR